MRTMFIGILVAVFVTLAYSSVSYADPSPRTVCLDRCDQEENHCKSVCSSDCSSCYPNAIACHESCYRNNP